MKITISQCAIVCGALLILNASLTSCGGKKENQKAKTEAAENPSVDTLQVTSGMVEVTDRFNATIQSSVKNNISALTGGRLRQLLVKVGDHVSKGQVVAHLDDSQLAQLQVQMNKAEIDFKRMDELHKIGGVSQMQWESARDGLNIARTQYHNILQNTVLRSPVSGMVTAKNYDNGDVTNPQMPIVVVEQINPVKLILNISEDYFTRLKKRMPVHVTIDALDGQEFTGYISLIHPTVDAMAHTVQTEIEIPNANETIRPGMYATAQINFGSHQATLVSESAVMKLPGAGQRYVFVYNNGKAEYRPVELGDIQGEYYEVIGGLQAGETVIVGNKTGLTDGLKVKVR